LSDSISSPTPAPETGDARTVVAGKRDFSASLDSFQGPLDLLLHLVQANEVEITEIPVSRILDQYLQYLDRAGDWDLQLAGEFLVMATTLMEIKSRELLPVQETPVEEDLIEDPRSELVRQLLRYRRLKEQARTLEELETGWARRHARGLKDEVPEIPIEEQNLEFPEIDLFEMLAAYEKLCRAVLSVASARAGYQGETLEDKIERIEKILKEKPFARFHELLSDDFTRPAIAMTFIALLELVRRRMVRLVQAAEFGNLDVKTQSVEEADNIAREESEAAEAVSDFALKEKSDRDSRLAEQAAAEGMSVDQLPWKLRRKAIAKPKFQGVVLPEDLEEIDAEEAEITRRIDAILAAADSISQRFEDSKGGEILPGPDGAHGEMPKLPPEPAEEAPLTAADLAPVPESAPEAKADEKQTPPAAAPIDPDPPAPAETQP